MKNLHSTKQWAGVLGVMACAAYLFVTPIAGHHFVIHSHDGGAFHSHAVSRTSSAIDLVLIPNPHDHHDHSPLLTENRDDNQPVGFVFSIPTHVRNIVPTQPNASRILEYEKLPHKSYCVADSIPPPFNARQATNFAPCIFIESALAQILRANHAILI